MAVLLACRVRLLYEVVGVGSKGFRQAKEARRDEDGGLVADEGGAVFGRRYLRCGPAAPGLRSI